MLVVFRLPNIVLFSKITPPFFTIKEVIFLKTYPSFLTVKEGSTFLSKPLFPQEREDVTALRCSEPLRYKVGGPSKISPCCAGWYRLSLLSVHNLQYCLKFTFAEARRFNRKTYTSKCTLRLGESHRFHRTAYFLKSIWSKTVLNPFFPYQPLNFSFFL